MKSRREKPSARSASLEPRVFNSAHEAAANFRGKWREWKEAGVQFSRFHIPGTDFALPFDPSDYLWAGPVMLKLDLPEDGSAITEEVITGVACANI